MGVDKVCNSIIDRLPLKPGCPRAAELIVKCLRSRRRLGILTGGGPRLDRRDTVGAGTFWGVLNVSLRATGTQLGLDLTCFVIRHLSLTGGSN